MENRVSNVNQVSSMSQLMINFPEDSSDDDRDAGESLPDESSRPARLNRINDLSPKEWIRFQKSWFVHAPPRRAANVVRHPAKFPETLAQEFIEFFTKRGHLVLDPMVGTGSTLIAAARAGRAGIGVELSDEFAAITESELRRVAVEENLDISNIKLFHQDAREVAALGLPPVDYCITSPPYWDMLRQKGYETQQERRERGLPVTYSDSDADLGNIADYDRFVEALTGIYLEIYHVLRPGAYLTVIVKNVKKGPRMYPLAWDIARGLSSHYTLKDERIWCQDDQRLAPYGMFNAWVSNTHHHYCLMFRKEPEPKSHRPASEPRT
jgi:DNA modification methylase